MVIYNLPPGANGGGNELQNHGVGTNGNVITCTSAPVAREPALGPALSAKV